MRLIFDIETDGLKPTVVWVIVTKDIDTQEVKTFYKPFDTFNEYISKAEEVIGHNIIGYDIPVCERLLGTTFDHCKVTDTLVLSLSLIHI